MRLRLFPRETKFFDLFVAAADNTVEGARAYLEMVRNYTDPKGSHTLIRELEHKGDDLIHETIRSLNQTFVTPIDREDIHGLSTDLDDIMDFIEAGSDIFNLHRIEEPTRFMRDQAAILLRISEAVAAAMRDLRKFKGLEAHWIEINSIENEGDQVYRKAIAELFSGDYKAMEVLKNKEVYDQIEAAIDRCEDVANRLESIVLKHA
jgi:hypothetical protein